MHRAARMLLLGGRAPFTGPLDPFAGQLYAVGGPHRALSSYTGPCWRVRRATDNAEQDIGFTSDGWADSAQILSFAAGATVYIVRDYDKTGNGRDGLQTSTGSQFRIVDAGALDVGTNGRPAPFLDGVNDFMEVQNALGFSRNAAALTIAAIARATGAGAQNIATTSIAGGTSVRATLAYFPNATTPVLQGRSTDAASLSSVPGAAVATGAWIRSIGRARYAGGEFDISVNGAVSTTAISPAQNTPDSNSQVPPRLGTTPAGASYLPGGIGTWVLARNSLDITALNSAFSQMMP